MCRRRQRFDAMNAAARARHGDQIGTGNAAARLPRLSRRDSRVPVPALQGLSRTYASIGSCAG